MDKRKNEYVELARLIEAEFHARQDAGILANLNKKNVEGLHVTRDKILKDMREQLKDYQDETGKELTEEEKKTYFFIFNVEGLLRGDYQSRMQGYATARQNGWMSANDIRELENLDKIPTEEGGDMYLVNGNMMPLEMAGAAYAASKGKEENLSEEQEVLELEKSDQSARHRRRR